ncbi:MAG: sulfotransferase domain-containing protein [Chromatiaceae bacterium]|nr:sulfotransferase domain-containing protein [Chromatiaceae bacterium]MCP5422330.1 sulfotransferase domain-containing protein [Chromatiaceae bacterium]
MLVICNGAIKSGSTWLYNILLNLRTFERPPEQYLTANSRKRTKNPCIEPDLLESFLRSEDVTNRHFLSKNHIGRPAHRDLLVSNPHVLVFDIDRDVRDMVVSAYYDDCNRNGYQGTFAKHYWERGRYLADDVIRYHALWRNTGDRFCMVSYEGLHADFASQVLPIAKMLAIELDAEGVAQLKERTSIGTLRKRYQDEALYKDDKFFRRGVVGDWQNHFDKAIEDDLASIERNGIGALDRRLLLKKFRHALHRRR